MKTTKSHKRGFSALGLLFFLAFFTNVSAQTTSFTYQGRLTDGAVSANGTYQMQFSLYGSVGGSDLVGSTITNANVSVVNGSFTVSLDFGAGAFPGAERYLEIAVKKSAEAGYTTLTPRQQITSSPYAVRALNASNVEATTGNSVVNAINNAATNVTINENRLPSNIVRAMPDAQQSFTSTTGGTDPILNLGGNYTNSSGTFQSTFRLNQDGGFVSIGNFDDGVTGGVPAEGSGTRFMWFPRKAAFRAGYINGTQWDDANIGLYSVAFGENVRALGDNSIAVGKNTVAANTGTVALGEGNLATGANSVALGYGASTSTIAGSPRLGTFVFSDRSVPLCYQFGGTSPDPNCQFHPTVTNSFNVRAVNGSFFYTNTALTTGLTFNSTTANLTLNNSKLSMKSDGSTTLTSNSGGTAGVDLPAGGGSWSSLSDRNMKENFAAVNSREMLQKVLNLPIQTWNYKTQNTSVRHIGAMAQDFYRLFGVGEDDKRIATIDPDGVAFSAIQGLYSEIKDRDRKIAEQDKQLQEQSQKLNVVQEQVKQQQAAIDALKKLVCAGNPTAEVCQ